MPPRKKAKDAAAHKKRNQHRSKSQSADPYVTGKGKDGSCPIVGIGGSAGGFEAAMELLRHLPSKTGMAFVIVQHLDPHHGSRLPNLLGKATSIPRPRLQERLCQNPRGLCATAGQMRDCQEWQADIGPAHRKTQPRDRSFF